jgi:hypothetical protein
MATGASSTYRKDQQIKSFNRFTPVLTIENNFLKYLSNTELTYFCLTSSTASNHVNFSITQTLMPSLNHLNVWGLGMNN